MDNMTGAEKAKEIRNSIFALLIAFIFLFPIYWLIQISQKKRSIKISKKSCLWQIISKLE